MLKSLDNNNFYKKEIGLQDLNSLSYEAHSPLIYNANGFMVSKDVRFCIKQYNVAKEKEGSDFYNEVVNDIYFNYPEIPDKPYARQTTIVSVKKEKL